MCSTHILSTLVIKLNKMYYVYIVRCSDNSLYTGITSNIKKRVNEHNTSKKGAKSVRGKLPVKLVYKEKLENLSKALKREIEIKTWKKDKKENLIALSLADRK